MKLPTSVPSRFVSHLPLLILALLLDPISLPLYPRLGPSSCAEAASTISSVLSYDKLLNMSVTNCTGFIPNASLTYMAAYSAAYPNISMTVPQMFLRNCIKAVNYDRRVSAFTFAGSNLISFSISLNQLLSLDFEGYIRMKVNLDYQWIDPRLRWNMAAPPMAPTWTWPAKTNIHNTELWIATVEVINCDWDDCSFQPHNNTYLTVKGSAGKVNMLVSKQMEIKCHLNFTLFPFDVQNCSLFMALENNENMQEMFLSYNFTVWNGWNAYAMYNEENEGWLVTSIDVSTLATSLLILQENTQTNWTETVQYFGNATGVRVSLIFTRAGNYFVLNLLLPLLVIVFIANSTIFIPADGTEKAELQLEVLMAFTLYQLLLADNTPRTNYVPLMGMYIVSSFILAAIHLLASLLVLRLHRFAENSIVAPFILRAIILRPVRFLFAAMKWVALFFKKHIYSRFKKKECVLAWELCVNEPDESWHSVARYVNVLVGAIYFGANVALVVIFLAPLAEAWAISSNSVPYYSRVES